MSVGACWPCVSRLLPFGTMWAPWSVLGEAEGKKINLLSDNLGSFSQDTAARTETLLS